jgi:hypothetical protein
MSGTIPTAKNRSLIERPVTGLGALGMASDRSNHANVGERKKDNQEHWRSRRRVEQTRYAGIAAAVNRGGKGPP